MIRTPQTLKTRSPGGYVGLDWVDGAETDLTLLGSVQPATKGDYERLQAELGGRRTGAAVRLYTDVKLNVAGQDAKNGDVLIWEGDRYIVCAVSPWRTTIIRHYRYLAAKELEPDNGVA